MFNSVKYIKYCKILTSVKLLFLLFVLVLPSVCFQLLQPVCVWLLSFLQLSPSLSFEELRFVSCAPPARLSSTSWFHQQEPWLLQPPQIRSFIFSEQILSTITQRCC